MTLCWGIAGTGRIARTVGAVLSAHPAMAVVAIGSHNAARAHQLATELDAGSAYPSYRAMIDDPRVEAVYVATPHAAHAEVAELALLAGKAVLCEKPLTESLGSSERLVGVARRSGSFLMEAMWMRFNPLVQRAAEVARSGELGTLRSLQASFGFAAPSDPAGRLWSPALGGGALLDIGVYGVDLARLLLGEPTTVAATGQLAATGVDAQATVSLGFATGAQALLDVSLLNPLPGTALLVGSHGYAELSPTFHAPTRLLVQVAGGPPQVHTAPDRAVGFVREVEEVAACLAAGRSESSVRPLADTVATMSLLDRAFGELRADPRA